MWKAAMGVACTHNAEAVSSHELSFTAPSIEMVACMAVRQCTIDSRMLWQGGSERSSWVSPSESQTLNEIQKSADVSQQGLCR